MFAATPSGSLQKAVVQLLLLLDSVLLWGGTHVNVVSASVQMLSPKGRPEVLAEYLDL